MSLLKELHPAVLEQIELERSEYPNLCGKIMNDIKEALLVTDLSLGTTTYLVGYYLGAGHKFDSHSYLLNVYQIFGR